MSDAAKPGRLDYSRGQFTPWGPGTFFRGLRSSSGGRLADWSVGQIVSVRERVGEADSRLERVLLPDVEIGDAEQPWWRRRVLARAGDEYADT